MKHDPHLMSEDLMEARGLLAELRGKLAAYAEYDGEPWRLSTVLRDQARRIDAFLNGDDNERAS